MQRLGTKTLILVVAGYATLVTYTWPYGFIPVVSIESLPIVLFGFALILLVVLLILGILFAPFSWLINEDLLRKYLYSEIHEPLDEKYINKSIKIPLTILVNDLCKTVGFSGLLFTVYIWLIVMSVSWYLWYGLSSEIGSMSQTLVLGVIMWLAYRSLVNTIWAKSIDDAIFPIVGVVLIFLILPMLGPDNLETKRPNVLVEGALRIVGAGGGLYAVVKSVNASGNVVDITRGELLFYDGTKAWLRECNINRVIAIRDVFGINIYTEIYDQEELTLKCSD